jgi:hypothetical protein
MHEKLKFNITVGQPNKEIDTLPKILRRKAKPKIFTYSKTTLRTCGKPRKC